MKRATRSPLEKTPPHFDLRLTWTGNALATSGVHPADEGHESRCEKLKLD
jgi:hypothetical protein